MSIPELWEKIKVWSEKEEIYHILMAFIVILVGLAGFGLGKLSKNEDLPVRIEYAQQGSISEKTQNTSADETVSTYQSGTIIASKNGTKYYFPDCRGVGNIKEENKIFFQSENEAVSAGYSKASGCK